MAAGSLLALLDDIASLLDDVSVMTQVAAKKTAGVLGDDLALNAQQVAGVHAERELPVVWAVAKGSFLNKLILVPSALTISYFAPAAILPLLMAGGLYLCFEGFEKIAHQWAHKDEDLHHRAELSAAIADANIDLAAVEKDKIKGAIRTDFVLSAEIIVIALGTVATAAFSRQAAVVTSIALLMTVGVYGLVAAIVKLDDLGLYLLLKKGPGLYAQGQRKIGQLLLAFAPKLMRSLSVIGTLAMFMVGGSIIGHGLAPWHHTATHITHWLQSLPALGTVLALLAPLILDALLGLLAGALSLAVFSLGKKIAGK